MSALSGRSLQQSLWKLSRRFLTSRQLVYSERGNPSKVVKLTNVDLSETLGPKQVLIRWLAAPVNPADINQIQGVYPVKPPLPAVGGSEGVGEVEKVGTDVSGFTQGDRVVIVRSGAGTWQTLGIYDAEDLVKIDKNMSLESAATFQVNPPTAYRMLSDFVTLRQGDLVIQNGANCTVGRAVIQIAHARGVRTVNLIRKSDHSEKVIEELKKLGADEVHTEDEMLKEYKGKVKNAKLAFNCVGGRSTLILASCLGQDGVLVTYGGMSKQPLQIPTGPLIFKNIHLRGFWMTEWYKQPENKKKRAEMFEKLSELVRQGKLQPPNVDKRSLDDWQVALEKGESGTGNKQLFIM
ncbi:unnamed protein product [Enterobius vermicularis]|uniref:Enoyl-[acyl-carrier-protein] reductase, mitochondrial n=1 Tax=Enterobius vermicularis TaxID=51028 RepID=A0A0N4V1I8_ENTVE|nr:unnamed protein product [Enterobius vermicularis]